MCGIFCLLNSKEENLFSIETNFNKCRSRGPESSNLLTDKKNNLTLGFHRLAINGLDSGSDQPIKIDNITLICNGEIYNYKDLYTKAGIEPSTNSDCEVIIHLYRKYGIEETLHLIDGVFAFVLCDFTKEDDKKIFVARDPYGVRPMFKLHTSYKTIGFASLLANLSVYKENIASLYLKDKMQEDGTNLSEDFFSKTINDNSLRQFTPGTYSEIAFSDGIWSFKKENTRFSHFGSLSLMKYNDEEFNLNLYLNGIREYLSKAVQKRVDNTDRKIACLLSGGLDSSLITALVNKYHDGPLETYSIGLPGSEDLKYARKVADYLKTNHTEIIVNEEDFFNAIPHVVKATETWDTTTIRASVGNYLIGKYISENSDAKVVFNGDGSDEVSGGYLYFHKAFDMIEFDKECKRLLSNIHFFDVLRSERCIAYHGLEARTPFLDKQFVQYYLSIPFEYRFHVIKNQPEKYLLRKAFDCNLLPKEILWRTKEAFSDGVSSLKKSWFEIIGERVESLSEFKKYDSILTLMTPSPKTNEQKYYRYLFENNYPGCGDVIPFYWMPKYTDAKDSSARTLDIFYETLSKTNSVSE